MSIWYTHELQVQFELCRTFRNGKWVCARPLPYFTFRLRLRELWLVLTGRGDVVIWPEGQ